MTKTVREDVEHRFHYLPGVNALWFLGSLREFGNNLIAVECRFYRFRANQIPDDVGDWPFFVVEEARDGGIDDSNATRNWNPNVPRTGA